MKKRWLFLILFVVIVAISVPIVRFQIDKNRRRHQIGQLWMLIKLYYIPTHSRQYPNELAELRQLPKYSFYFDQAVRKIDLMTPGLNENALPPNTVVLKEKSPDEHGYYWFHYADGSIEYRRKP